MNRQLQRTGCSIMLGDISRDIAVMDNDTVIIGETDNFAVVLMQAYDR